jgi:hypothetical protein
LYLVSENKTTLAQRHEGTKSHKEKENNEEREEVLAKVAKKYRKGSQSFGKKKKTMKKEKMFLQRL